jgi:hypothetical protein
MTDIPLPRENTGVSAASSLRANLAERLAELAADPLSWIGVAAVAFGIAVRAWMISGPMGTPDMDAATVAAQANAFLDGHLGVFFLNQAYGGTLEVGVVAAAFGIGGPNVAMLTLVPMVLHAAAALLCWRVARRVTADRLARFLVPCFVWTFPAGMVLTSIKERGFYGATVVLAALSMLLALRIAQEGAMRIDVVGLGLVAGLGWWTTPLLAPVAFASGVWVLARSDRARRQIPALAGAAMLGAAPWLVWNFMNGWASLGGGRMPGLGWSDGASSWLHSLGLLSGTATPWDAQRNLIPWWLAAIVVGAVVVVAWLRTRREVGWLIPGIVLVTGLTAPFNPILALTPDAPRYLYPLVPVAAVATAVLVPQRRRWSDALVASGVLLIAGALTIWGLVGLDAVARQKVPPNIIASPGIHQVVDLLKQQGETVVTTDAAGMQIHFLSGGEIAASSFGVPRVPEFERLAFAAPTTTFVLEDSRSDNAKRLLNWANDTGTPIAYKAHFGRFWVVGFDQRVTPQEAGLVVFGGFPVPEPSDEDPG